MNFSQAVEAVRDRSKQDIVTIVGETVKLKRSGSDFEGLCPFHDEKTPSFRVKESGGFYNCFGCGKGGDAIDFVMKTRGLDFREAILELAKRYNLDVDNKVDESYKSQRNAEEEIIPGITEKRGEIRKAGKVYVAFDISSTLRCARCDGMSSVSLSAESGANEDENPIHDLQPLFYITPPISREEAEILWKYADQVVIIPGNGTKWAELRDSLKELLPFSIHVKIFCQYFIETKEEDWLRYIVPEVGGLYERKEVSRLIGLIKDGLDRELYTTEFANLLETES